MSKKESPLRHTISNPFNARSRWENRWWYPERVAYILLFGILANCDILNANSRHIQKDRIDKINIFQVIRNHDRIEFGRNSRSIHSFSEKNANSNNVRESRHHDIDNSKTHGRLTELNNEKEQPYLDEEGNICQDKIEVMEHVEYDTQIHCKVKMKKHCDKNYRYTHNDPIDRSDIGVKEDEGKEKGNGKDVNEDQVCHTMTMKECETSYRPQMTKVKVRVCPDKINLDNESAEKMKNSVVIDVRPTPMPKFVRQAKCVNGKRAMCVTKYETMCTNKEVTHEMTEDYPRCRVEMMKKCSNKSQNLQHILFGSKGNNNCHKVPAMRCRIEKRKVIKRKPETRCKRMPRQFCRNENCEDTHKTSTVNILDEELCYYRIQMVNEIVPHKKCKYVPKRMCHTRVTSVSTPRSQIKSSIAPIGTPSSRPPRKVIAEEDRHVSRGNLHEKQTSKDSGLPEHLRNFKEFHTLPPPSSSKFIVLNRRIKRSSRKGKCTMVPEERCQNIRVNPKPVYKEMKRKICRKPRLDVSAYDRELVRRLQMWAKSISEEDDAKNEHYEENHRNKLQQNIGSNTTTIHRNNIDFQP